MTSELATTVWTDTAEPNTGYIKRVIDYLCEPDQVIEVRMPGTHRSTVSGYFDAAAKLAESVAEWDRKAPGIYLTLNPVNPDLLARSVATGASNVRSLRHLETRARLRIG